MKEVLVKTAKRLIQLPFVPFGVAVSLARIDRRFRHLIPANHELVFEEYQGDIRVNVNTVYPIEREMLTGQYDPTTSAVIRRFVKPTSVCMDIGANVGALTLLMAKIANQGKIFALEPGPPIFRRLLDNLALNSQLRAVVVPLQIGLGQFEGELLWREDENNRGNAGLSERTGTPVPVTTLDLLIESHGIMKLEFVKLDVEGMEYEVFKGARVALARLRPVIYFETLEIFRALRGFDVFREINMELRELGYSLFFVERNGELVRTETLDILRSANVVAIPSSAA